MGRTMRLDKLIAHMGYGTRSAAKKLIKSGAVLVNGALPSAADAHVDPERDEIRVFEEPVHYAEHVYYMMNKPPGVVSATVDRDFPTVVDLVPETYVRRGLFPVGRLDRDAVGLLLLTDDGALAHRLTSPRHAVEKEYEVRAQGVLTEADVERFAAGLLLEDGTPVRPARLEIVQAGPESIARVTITEGKYHQVKRMFLVIGKPVRHLKRVRIGPLLLDEGLSEGALRPLTEPEVRALKEAAR